MTVANDTGNVLTFFSKDELEELEKLDREITAEEDMIETIQNLLHRALSGELKGFAYATVAQDGTVGTGWDGHNCRADLGMATNLLNHRYCQALLENKQIDD